MMKSTGLTIHPGSFATTVNALLGHDAESKYYFNQVIRVTGT
jgi:hypothetical protein